MMTVYTLGFFTGAAFGVATFGLLLMAKEGRS